MRRGVSVSLFRINIFNIAEELHIGWRLETFI